MADGFEFGESAGLFVQARPAGGEEEAQGDDFPRIHGRPRRRLQAGDGGGVIAARAVGKAKGVIGGGEEIGGGDRRAESAAWARDASSIWFRSA